MIITPPQGQTAAHLGAGTACDIFHRITLAGGVSRYSAWFDRFGDLVDCERIDRLNRSYPCTADQMDQLRRGNWSARQHIRCGYLPLA